MGVVSLTSAVLLCLVTRGAEWSVLLVFPVTVVAFILAPDVVGDVPMGWYRRGRSGDRDVAGKVTRPGDVVVFWDGRAGVHGVGVVELDSGVVLTTGGGVFCAVGFHCVVVGGGPGEAGR